MTSKPLIARFIDTQPRMLLELTNTTEIALRHVDILTIFLKDETTTSGPSRAHIRFDRIDSLQPKEKAVVAHKTWINNAPAGDSEDQLARLEAVAGEIKPYVLDICWEDLDGKTQFQRIPVGH